MNLDPITIFFAIVLLVVALSLLSCALFLFSIKRAISKFQVYPAGEQETHDRKRKQKDPPKKVEPEAIQVKVSSPDPEPKAMILANGKKLWTIKRVGPIQPKEKSSKRSLRSMIGSIIKRSKVETINGVRLKDKPEKVPAPELIHEPIHGLDKDQVIRGASEK